MPRFTSHFTCLYESILDFQHKHKSKLLKQKVVNLARTTALYAGMMYGLYNLYNWRLANIEKNTYTEFAVDNVVLYQATAAVMSLFSRIEDKVNSEAREKVMSFGKRADGDQLFTKSVLLINGKMRKEIDVYELRHNKVVEDVIKEYGKRSQMNSGRSGSSITLQGNI